MPAATRRDYETLASASDYFASLDPAYLCGCKHLKSWQDATAPFPADCPEARPWLTARVEGKGIIVLRALRLREGLSASKARNLRRLLRRLRCRDSR